MEREPSPEAETVRLTDDLVGYEVEGRDEHIGRVERVSHDGQWTVVSTGRLFGHRYVVPLESVRLVDSESEAILVDLSKDEVQRSPEYDDHAGLDDDGEAALRTYYGGLRVGRSRNR